MNTLILASTSPYRRSLLERLGLPFETWPPSIDECALTAESPAATAARLAREKARAGARNFPDAWIIGSDQVADDAGRAIGKPGSLDAARAQLLSMSGRTVVFHTALCIVRPGGAEREALVPTEVVFRELTAGEIDRYLAREPAIDCAGSAKSEALGISLLARLRGDDPTALVGLPLIALADMLREEGFQVP